jgi:small subunit ribosomal protein S17
MADTEPTGVGPADTAPGAPPGEAAPEEPIERAARTNRTASEARSRPNRRKVREGIVVSDGMDKTAVVRVVQRVRHRRYGKTVQRSSKLFAHDAANEARIGDRVQVAECRPLSRLKRWRMVKVLERAR